MSYQQSINSRKIRQFLETRDVSLLATAFSFEETRQGADHWRNIVYGGVAPTDEDIRYLEDALATQKLPQGEP